MYPQFIEAKGKQYKINTDFRVAIECNRIAEDATIGDLERTLGIIYLLFGNEAINDSKKDPELVGKFLDLAKTYLLCDKEYDEEANSKPDMDFDEDFSYISTSFLSDYHINLDDAEMHWWKFMDLMNGLSNSELGDCCILNRIRNLRNLDPKTIKDTKEREKIRKAQKQIALKKYQKPKKEATEEQIKSAEEFMKALERS